MMNYPPFIYAFLKPQKPFNPSANPSFSLILIGKMAEGFGFQTLQTLQRKRIRDAALYTIIHPFTFAA